MVPRLSEKGEGGKGTGGAVGIHKNGALEEVAEPWGAEAAGQRPGEQRLSPEAWKPAAAVPGAPGAARPLPSPFPVCKT